MQKTESSGKWKVITVFICHLGGSTRLCAWSFALLSIYVDGLAQLSLSDGSQTVLYADDLLLFQPISGKDDFLQLQYDISLVENWVKCNLTLNPTKCEYMVISRKRNPVDS